MKFKRETFACDPTLLSNVEPAIAEIEATIDAIQWQDNFRFEADGESHNHQTAYNKAFANKLDAMNWDLQPRLCYRPSLVGDASKDEVFVEIQFGHNVTLFRDLFKFHYGFMKGLLSLAVLIVPERAAEFFPTRNGSVRSMAEYGAARRLLKPSGMPVMLIGLLPEN